MGEIDFEGTDLLKLDEKGYNNVRGAKIGMIFQDPLSALNPLKRIEDQIQEVMIYHTDMTEKQRHARVIELLNQVGIEILNVPRTNFHISFPVGCGNELLLQLQSLVNQI